LDEPQFQARFAGGEHEGELWRKSSEQRRWKRNGSPRHIGRERGQSPLRERTDDLMVEKAVTELRHDVEAGARVDRRIVGKAIARAYEHVAQ
jgi:hypothetical protein